MKNNTHNLLIVCQTSGVLEADVANEALNRYDKVVLMANRCTTMERPLDKRIQMDRIIKYDKSTAIKRILTWLWATIQIFHKILWHYRDYEVMYFTNPPTSYFCSRLLRNKYRIAVLDLYPDALRTIGLGQNSLVWRFWAHVNRKAFAKAERVITLGESMKRQIAHYCEEEHIIVATPWSGSSQFCPVAKENNPFLKQLGIEHKFVVLYSGNIGYTHSVEVLVEVAQMMVEDTDVLFLIIGQGKKKQEIEQMVKEYGLTNVMMLDRQPIEILPYSLGAADLGVVTLDENVAAVSVPSKTFNLFAVGAPILAIATEQTEMYRLLTHYNNGRCIPKSNVADIKNFIQQLKEDPDLQHKMRDNSLKAAQDFTVKNAELYFK